MQGIHFKNDTDETSDDLSAVLLANMAVEKEVLNCLRKQLEDLRRQLSGKDQLLKEAEAAKNKISTIQSQVNELKQLAAEKDSLTKSSQLQACSLMMQRYLCLLLYSLSLFLDLLYPMMKFLRIATVVLTSLCYS